ncbi:MAG: TIGR02281 family clan AA aspartic protease [Pseudomonadota bacterium]
MELAVANSYMLIVDIDNLLANIWAAIGAVPRSGLLMFAVGAVLAGFVGSMMVRRKVPLGQFVRTGSTLVLVGILATVVVQLSRFDPRLEVAVPDAILPQQIVEGGETRIPINRDGHFWLRAELNGVPANFLVDTGATLTAVSQGLADRAGLEPRAGGLPVSIGTANGPVEAQLSTIDELRFGNVAARGLDVVIAPSLGGTNVIGMNLLSRLASYRVDNRTNEMILVPNNPQAALELP